MQSIEGIKKEYNKVIEELSKPEVVSDWEKFEELSKKKKEMDKLMDKIKEAEELERKIEENETIIASSEPELKDLAEVELTELTAKEKEIKKELDEMLKREESPTKNYSAIIEIRAGAGGDEAGLFASDLYKMYSKYADSKGWGLKTLESHPSEIGGFKEIIFELKGPSYEEMKYEGGVHRVQRIPETEKQGRVHTSTASVAVLPKPKKTEIKIKPDEIKVDYYRASGPGGQYVNKRETAVRITHLPTGIVVTSQTERNQLQNKENALAILHARILEKKEEEKIKKLGGKRKEQIGKAQRAEKIRTYNFPQDRITDHRIKKSWHGIEEIMSGKLDKIISILKEKLE